MPIDGLINLIGIFIWGTVLVLDYLNIKGTHLDRNNKVIHPKHYIDWIILICSIIILISDGVQLLYLFFDPSSITVNFVIGDLLSLIIGVLAIVSMTGSFNINFNFYIKNKK